MNSCTITPSEAKVAEYLYVFCLQDIGKLQ